MKKSKEKCKNIKVTAPIRAKFHFFSKKYRKLRIFFYKNILKMEKIIEKIFLRCNI